MPPSHTPSEFHSAAPGMNPSEFFLRYGGKRAFLPTAVSRTGDFVYAQLTYFGKPWKVAARRQGGPPVGACGRR